MEWASCKDQEAAARAADRAAASEVPLTAFSDAADRLLPRVVDLQGELGTVVEAVTTLREGALARIAAAEEASRKALERTELAEAGERRSTAVAARAKEDAQEAVEARRGAERLLRDETKEFERQLADERGKRLDETAARSKAEERARAATADLQALQKRFERLAAERDGLLAEKRELQTQVSVSTRDLEATREELEDLRRQLEDRAGELTAAGEAAAAATAGKEAAERELELARTELARRADEVSTVREEAVAAKASEAATAKALQGARGNLERAEADLEEGRREQERLGRALSEEKSSAAVLRVEAKARDRELELATAALADAAVREQDLRTSLSEVRADRGRLEAAVAATKRKGDKG